MFFQALIDDNIKCFLKSLMYVSNDIHISLK